MSAPTIPGDGVKLEPTTYTLPDGYPPMVPVSVALAAAMREVTHLGKGDVNAHFGYKFRGIDATVNAVGPALRKHGIIPLPRLESIDYRDVKTAKGKDARESSVRVVYRFVGPLGDWLDAIVPGEAVDEADKGTAKAMSVAFRIALLQTFALPTDEPDPDAGDFQRGDQRAAALAEAAGKYLVRMLDADRDALSALWNEVYNHPAATVDVSGQLGAARRLLTSLPAEGPVTLVEARNAIRDFVRDHDRAVTAPAPTGTGQPPAQEQPAEEAPAEQPAHREPPSRDDGTLMFGDGPIPGSEMNDPETHDEPAEPKAQPPARAKSLTKEDVARGATDFVDYATEATDADAVERALAELHPAILRRDVSGILHAAVVQTAKLEGKRITAETFGKVAAAWIREQGLSIADVIEARQRQEQAVDQGMRELAREVGYDPRDDQ